MKSIFAARRAAWPYGNSTSTLSPMWSRAASYSNTWPTAQTTDRSASLNDVISGVTYCPANASFSTTTPSNGELIATVRAGAPTCSSSAICASVRFQRRMRSREAASSASAPARRSAFAVSASFRRAWSATR